MSNNKTNKIAVESTAKNPQKGVVTTKAPRAEYIARGTATPSKDKKTIIVTLDDGTKLLISRPKSDKQMQYYRYYKSHRIYDEYIVQEIVENEDLKPQHKNEEQPEKNKLDNVIDATREHIKKQKSNK